MANEERCIICNKIIPEGRQVCPNCESNAIEVEEAQICLKCPYKKCKDGWGIGCDHYKERMKAIREKYRKRRGKTND